MAIENANDSIIIIECPDNTPRNCKIIYVNQAFTDITGYKFEEVQGKSTEILKGEKTNLKEEQEAIEALKLKKPYRISNINYRKDGTMFWYEANNVPFGDYDSKITRWVSVRRDITEKKIAEEKLKKTMNELKRSNKELNQYGYAISHDLKQPLNVINGYLQLIQMTDKIDEEFKSNIQIAINTAKEMQKMIEDLLEYSRLGTGSKRFEKISLNQVYLRAVNHLESVIKSKNAKIFSDELPEIYANESELVRLFQNLIENGIKYSQKDVPPEIHISHQTTEEYIQINIKDNGMGVPSEQYDRIFDIFHQLHSAKKRTGSGIGLASCKKIVEYHGGKIWINSEIDKGSTFHFTLPIKGENF